LVSTKVLYFLAPREGYQALHTWLNLVAILHTLELGI
jgi:hypothetical protein